MRTEHRNSLNLVRLVLAAVVIVSHAPRPYGDPSPAVGGLEIGGWAVAGFFGISGYLISASRNRLPLGRYLWHRAVRILPGYWACLAVTAFVLVPLAGLISGGTATIRQATAYVVANAGLHVSRPAIGHSLDGSAMSQWNLSLWTLEIEVLCYLGLGLAFTAMWARSREAVLAGWALLTVASVAVGVADVGGLVGGSIRLGAFFASGAVLQRLDVPIRIPGALAALTVLPFLVLTDTVALVGGLPLTYLVLWAGEVLPQPSWIARHDLSYGVYVYGFPVQQLVALAGVGVVASVPLTLLAVAPLAAASWFLVERPALRLKHLGRRTNPPPDGATPAVVTPTARPATV